MLLRIVAVCFHINRDANQIVHIKQKSTVFLQLVFSHSNILRRLRRRIGVEVNFIIHGKSVRNYQVVETVLIN